MAAPLPSLDLTDLIGDTDLRVPEVTADILYADEIRADVVTISESHVEDVRIRDQ